MVRWDAARGFGFIRTAGQGADVFFHARDIVRGSTFEPREGLAVAFDVIHVGGKGPRAVAVHVPGSGTRRPASPMQAPRGQRTRQPAPSSGGGLVLLLFLGYAAALGWAVWARVLPWWVAPALLFINVATFFAYGFDKFAAERGRWRTPEKTLHLWSLAGGWPLARVAQQVLRHKSSKQEFQAAYWSTVVMHLAGFAGALWWISNQ